MALSADDIARYAYAAGFRGQALQWMTAIALRESGGNPAAYNPNVHTGDQSWGLWQINTLGALGPARSKQLQSLGYSGDLHELLDPAVNAKMAFALSNGGTNFEPWRSASPGWGGPQGFLTNATQYLDQAASAASKVQLGGASNLTSFTQGAMQARQGQGTVQTKLVAWLQQQVGKDYVANTSGPNTFDCSGLSSALYRDVLGINMPALTWTQAQYGMPVNADSLQAGDLVFFHGAPQPGHPDGNLGHMGIYIGGGQYIQAPHTGAKVQVSTLDPSRVQAARRIIDATGRVITGAGITPPMNPGVGTVPIGQAVSMSNSMLNPTTNPTLNLNLADPTKTAAPADSFTLPSHDFTNVLPGEGAKVESLV